jgi:restriction system protein
MRSIPVLLIFLSLISTCRVYAEERQEQTSSDECYRNGDIITVRGIATTQQFTMPNGSLTSAIVLTATQPICIIDSKTLTEDNISRLQLTGSPPVIDSPIEVKGKLSTGNASQYYAEPTAIEVINGYLVFDTNPASNNTITPPTLNQVSTPTQPPIAVKENTVIISNESSDSRSVGNVLSTILIGGLVFWGIQYYRKQKAEKRRFRKALDIAAEYSGDLSIRKKQLTIPGAYGVVNYKPWINDVSFFIEKVIYPVTGNFDNVRQQELELAIDMFANNPIAEKKIQNAMSPIEYEASVAIRLQENGWDARTTKGSGDQGIDVIARKNGIKLVIQCKLYTSPVGNAAVQEIIAGREFEKADYAAVVSNIGYTKAARQLAANANILLLHHDELDNLEVRLEME